MRLIGAPCSGDPRDPEAFIGDYWGLLCGYWGPMEVSFRGGSYQPHEVREPEGALEWTLKSDPNLSLKITQKPHKIWSWGQKTLKSESLEP